MPRQPDLLPRSKSPTIPVANNHRLVHIADTLDWDELQQCAQQIRLGKLKNAAGQPPHLRATLGAMVLMATRKLTYREAEDLIQYYIEKKQMPKFLSNLFGHKGMSRKLRHNIWCSTDRRASSDFPHPSSEGSRRLTQDLSSPEPLGACQRQRTHRWRWCLR